MCTCCKDSCKLHICLMHVLIFLCLYHYCLRQESPKFKLLCTILYVHNSVIRWLLIRGFGDNSKIISLSYLITLSGIYIGDINNIMLSGSFLTTNFRSTLRFSCLLFSQLFPPMCTDDKTNISGRRKKDI